MPPRDLRLIRHAQSTSNAGLITVGQANVPLSPLGIEQADAIARAIERPPNLLVTSAFVRSQASAEPIRARWPDVRREIWPIHEITYLSPSRCAGTTADVRQPWIDAYWRRCDPLYVDGADAESFAAFISRVTAFHRRLLACDDDFVVAVGHGQFFRAFLLGLTEPLRSTAAFMEFYRRNESSLPLANGQIVHVTSAQIIAATPNYVKST